MPVIIQTVHKEVVQYNVHYFLAHFKPCFKHWNSPWHLPPGGTRDACSNHSINLLYSSRRAKSHLLLSFWKLSLHCHLSEQMLIYPCTNLHTPASMQHFLCEHGQHKVSFLSAAGPTFWLTFTMYVTFIAQPYRGSLPGMLVTPKIKAFVLINMNKGQSNSSVQCLQTAQLTRMSVFLLLYLQIRVNP